jgi:signal transduction histidine kinase
VTAQLSSPGTVAEVVERVVNEGASAAGAAAARLLLLDADQTALHTAGASGFLLEGGPADTPLSMDQPLPETAAVRTGQPQWLTSHAALQERYASTPLENLMRGCQAVVCLPIRVHQQPFGVLTCCFTDTDQFSAEDQSFLLALAQQCGLAYERADLYEAEQRARALLETRVRERTAELQASNQSLEREFAEHRKTEYELQRSHEQLRRLSQHLQAAREEERSRISREIHDELGGAVTSLKMELAQLRRYSTSDGPDKQQLARFDEMSLLLEHTLDAVRRIATDLRPSILDHFGLGAAIEWQLDEFRTRSGLLCSFTPPANDVNLPHEHTTALFRVFQETLTNIARHAQASRVDVRLENLNSHLLLEVRDDGRGISPQDLATTQSLGLVGMRERVNLMQGELAIQGQPGQGTTVQVKIPVVNES